MWMHCIQGHRNGRTIEYKWFWPGMTPELLKSMSKKERYARIWDAAPKTSLDF